MSSIADLAAQRPRIAAETHPPAPSQPPDDAFVWPDARGGALAICRFVGERAEITLPALGRFTAAESGEVLAYVRDGRSEELLLRSYYRLGLPLLLHARGAEVLHASAVWTDAGVVGFCADSGTGKSTTAWALSRRGYPAWADDTLVFAHGDRIEAVGLPFEFRLRADVRDRLAGPLDVSPGRAPEAPVQIEPLAALCLLERSDRAGSVTRLGAADAFKRVLLHSLSFQLSEPQRNAKMVDTYMTVADSIPVYEATVGHSLDELPALVDAIEHEILGQPPPRRGGAS